MVAKPRKVTQKQKPKVKQKSAATETAELPPAKTRAPRICFERIIPDDLDPEREVRRALRSEIAAHGKKTLSADDFAHAARMAVINSKKWTHWGKGFVLRCRFLDGTPMMQRKVRTIAREWEQHANIKLKFVSTTDAEIRISFYADEGSWSAVGRDCMNASYFPRHQPTMNFGWVRDDSDPDEDRAVILHEFGHALGCIHEHQSPKFERKWNKAAVLQYFRGAPNYWNDAEINHNVLGKYSPKGITASNYDPESIMLYTFDAALFSDDGGATNENTKLSTTDKAMIKKLYPA